MTPCLICKNPIKPFISFGKQPLANGFLKKEDFAKEYFFELKVCYCPKCYMVQLEDQPKPEQMFNENYAFFSGTSTHMAQHFQKFADSVTTTYLKEKDPFVVEIGCNDGILLKNFAQKKIRHLGIEPSANVAEVAKKAGINVLCKFFNAETAKEIVKKHGQADAYLAANVMCHIPYLHSVIEGMEVLMKPKGIISFEDPYLGEVIQKTSYDQIYDEHVFLFSAHSIKYAFEQHGFELIDLTPIPTHGGSMRYTLARKGAYPVSSQVKTILAQEEKLGLTKAQTFETFRKNCEESKTELLKLLEKLHQEKKTVVGYAATSKSTTVLNYCGITNKHIQFISDTTPIKQGKFTPGTHIPVLPHDKFKDDYPDYALLFGWNHKDEIMKKEQAFVSSGGKWILYVPKVEIISKK